MLHTVTQREPMGSIHLKPTLKVMSLASRHYENFSKPKKLKPLKSVIQIHTYKYIYILYYYTVLYPCTLRYTCSHLGESNGKLQRHGLGSLGQRLVPWHDWSELITAGGGGSTLTFWMNMKLVNSLDVKMIVELIILNFADLHPAANFD